MTLIWVTNTIQKDVDSAIHDFSASGTYSFNGEFPPGEYVAGCPQATKLKNTTELIQSGFVGIYYVE